MPTKMITTGTTFTSTGTTSTSAFQIPGYYYAPGSTVGYYIEGTDLSDYLWGSAKDDTMHGYSGNDVLYGQGGNDTIFGENGNDQLFGGVGNDKLDGGAEDDWLDGGSGADILIGGTGYDTVSYFNSGGVTVQLGYRGFGGDAEGDTYSGIENVLGSGGWDTIIGDAGDNRLDGGAGDDEIVGGAGRDILIGGLGKDRLTGDSSGVYGEDIFVIEKLNYPDNWQYDTITDFGGGDKIKLVGFSVTDLGSDGKLASGILYDDGLVRYAEDLDASDKLITDQFGGLFYGDFEMRDDGEWYVTNLVTVVDVGPRLSTGDLLFA